jgi:predicted PurR-regulated permease PerM
MPSDPGGSGPPLTDRERRWLDALLILGTCVVTLVLLGLLADVLLYFGDVILIFFLAWLLAFVLSPVANAIVRAVPVLPRGVAVLLTYALLLVGLSLLAIAAAQNLATSVSNFVSAIPGLQGNLPQAVKPFQDTLGAIGLRQVDLEAIGRSILTNIGSISSDLAKPLSDLAFASAGAFGSMLIILFLSLYIVLDRDRILAFAMRVVPPQYADEARLFERTVSRSFGGFLRGQAVMGLMYAAVAGAASLVLGLPYAPVTAAMSGILQAIPFFGPFVSWAPPVVVAMLTKSDVTLPTLLIMVAGWMVIMNVVQPRLMAESVGIHPIVVLGSVIVGSKVAGVAGAIFGIPVAAVLSSFFFYYLNRATADTRTVAARAARRVSQREGRPVRVPQPPSLTEVHRRADLDEPDFAAGVDPLVDVDGDADAGDGGSPEGEPLAEVTPGTRDPENPIAATS